MWSERQGRRRSRKRWAGWRKGPRTSSSSSLPGTTAGSLIIGWSATRRICILLPHGRGWWTKDSNNGEGKPIYILGAEPTIERWLDHVKFFGPRLEQP